jgi:hypothetical protein
LVKVERGCELPPKLKLPRIVQEKKCPSNWACYNIENAAQLAGRLSKMKNWIREVRLRCSIKGTHQVK